MPRRFGSAAGSDAAAVRWSSCRRSSPGTRRSSAAARAARRGRTTRPRAASAARTSRCASRTSRRSARPASRVSGTGPGSVITAPRPSSRGTSRGRRPTGSARRAAGSIGFEAVRWMRRDSPRSSAIGARGCGSPTRPFATLPIRPGRWPTRTPDAVALRRETPPIASRGQQSGRAYRPCPVCTRLMNRVNFGRRSGVLIDRCRAHGSWFDASGARCDPPLDPRGGRDPRRGDAA